MKVLFYRDGALLLSSKEWFEKGESKRLKEFVDEMQPWIIKNANEIRRIQQELQEAQKCITGHKPPKKGDSRETIIAHYWRWGGKRYIDTTCKDPTCLKSSNRDFCTSISGTAHVHLFKIGGIRITPTEISFIETSGQREMITVILDDKA